MSETIRPPRRTKKTTATQVASSRPRRPAEDMERATSAEYEIAQSDTAQQRDEKVTWASELDVFINAVPDGVAVYDTEGRVVRSNAAYRAILARFIPKRSAATLRERVSQSPLLDAQGRLLPEAQWPHTRMLQGEAIDGENAVEVMMYTADGEALRISVTGGPLAAADGRVIGAIAIHRDITMQKRLERDLRQRHDELNAIIEAVPDQVIVYDATLHQVRSNAAHRAAEQRYYPGEAPPGELGERIQRTQTVFRDLTGAPLPEGEWPQRRILRGETLSGPTAVETQASTVDGKAQWWSVSGAPLRAEDGTISGAVLVNSDITRRKELEQALQRANERFRLAERAANGFIYEWDVRTGFVYRSEGFERLLGYRPDEIPPTWTAWAQLVYPGDWQVRTDAEALAFVEALTGETFESEYRVRHRDGHYLTVAEHAVIERDVAGNVVRLIGQTHDITERKRMEMALRESETRFRQLADDAPLLIWIADEQARVTYANRPFLEYFGAPAQSLVETGHLAAEVWQRLVHPDDSAHLFDQYQRALRERQPWEMEVRLRGAASDTYQWHLVKGVPRYVGGQFAGFIGAGIEIDDRKRAEVAVAYLAAIVESADDAIVSKTLEGIVTSWNVSAERMFGYTEQEMIGQPILRLIPPDRHREEDLILARIRAGEPIEHFETVRMRKDGQLLEVSLTISPIHDRTGAIIGASKIVHDITEQRKLERQVAEQAERLQTIFETITDAVFLFDAHGQIVDANPAGRRQLPNTMAAFNNRSRVERIGSYAPRAADRSGIDPAEWPVDRLLHGEMLTGDSSVDMLTRLPDGRDRWLSVSGAPIRDQAGDVVGAVGVTRDITERRELEEEVRRARDKLEQRVAERTRELAHVNTKLRRLSQRILEVQESERRLIARELHDEIGQALTGVKIMLELLQTQDPPPEADTATAAQRGPRLGDVQEAVSDALEHVRDLSLILRPAILDSLGLLPALLWQCERYTRQTGIEVDVHQTGLETRLPPEIETVAYRLVQEALTNVARHAGVQQVTVQLLASDERLTLFVVDEGHGFDVERALDTGASTGLASMRERVDLLGGTLRIFSAPGEGTTIEADIPLHAPSAVFEVMLHQAADDLANDRSDEGALDQGRSQASTYEEQEA